ncbi:MULTISPECIES: formylglycine-generating enzyme family protein [unclassified Lentimicrobium]|uniref:formylglycine-generating enzyme family protein n=1 Tax=unclassified Lentimicrobium TaxID=2677434 RepID=UPI001556F751|nr:MULTISPECIES: formylglycine-generating enzyme family protein [unclassified Lentimicrobium]NPD47644.1 SUMF1/EgtB/PvdO family nonheme iron enzyme [Lentimicrobium sp. S6]NPD86520.1 SUMF1/EgtB/PvdO family nonheme iron enzyme [Lentimicrobium sp. L6]
MKPVNLIILYLTIFAIGMLTNSIFAQVLFVNIDVEPIDAEVYIDNQLCHPQNGPLELTKDKHILKIEKEGYFTIEEEIKVTKKSVYFNYSLIQNPDVVIIRSTENAKGYLRLKTDSDASILINDSLYSSFNILAFEKQELNIKAWKKGTDTIAKYIEIIEGDTLTLELFPKKQLSLENLNLEMVLVQGGGFIMGCEGSKENAQLHSVELDDFYIGKYEVTQFQWEMVMGTNPSQSTGDRLPVENVSWEDVQKFLKLLNGLTQKKYRLPTESEWEYAARGGHKLSSVPFKYSGGNSINNYAWYWRNSGDSILTTRFSNEQLKDNNCKAKQVGELDANQLGIHDMSGNVWEWCSDWYAAGYYKESPLKNPQGPETGKTRVCRGGGYTSKASFCRNGFRFSFPPTQSYDYLGFRLVLEK